MEKKKYPVINIGTASILVIFVILCLVTFAMLSLVSSNVDYQYSKKISDRTQDYYHASNLAEEKLNQIDEKLAHIDPINSDTYFQSAKTELDQLEFVQAQWDENTASMTAAYEVTMNDTTKLEIKLAITYPQNEGDGFYRILSWEEVSTKEWTTDNQINFMQTK